MYQYSSHERDGKQMVPVPSLVPTQFLAGSVDYGVCLYEHLDPPDNSTVHQAIKLHAKYIFLLLYADTLHTEKYGYPQKESYRKHNTIFFYILLTTNDFNLRNIKSDIKSCLENEMNVVLLLKQHVSKELIV